MKYLSILIHVLLKKDHNSRVYKFLTFDAKFEGYVHVRNDQNHYHKQISLHITLKKLGRIKKFAIAFFYLINGIFKY